ncbi:lipoprotein [Acidovorax sp. Leaf78]|uniref:LPS translocon maturation chaperone LptM n=1 Tax=unclassified Acidovorax TaxID=2684926 RepID=UPI0009E89520|nr:lipoprotein [Acidovorax sp. Leaf78]
MLKASQILVRTLVLAASAAALVGCGQRGPLFLPTGPAAAQRATLPETLTPNRDRTGSSVDNSTPSASVPPAAAAPADAASAPR